MKIAMKDFIAEGAFADVFSYQGKALKIFKSEKHPTKKGNSSYSAEKAKLVFESEATALEKASKIPGLTEHVPQYFEKGHQVTVTNDQNEDITEHYLLGCNYLMERFSGAPFKNSDLDDATRVAINEFCRQMGMHGIKYTKDSSFFILSNPNGFKVIDFAIEDAAYEYDLAQP